jgi:hypothetical protein
MTSLIARFQEVMGRIKALEAQKIPGAAALKLATIAAGNLSTSPKGIVAANAALDKVVKQVADLKAKLDKAVSGKGAEQAVPHDGKKLADEARRRLKALEARGQKAIAANPRNPNAGWLAEVVANSKRASPRSRSTAPSARSRASGSISTGSRRASVSFEAGAAEEAATKEAAPARRQGGKGDKDAEASPDAGAAPGERCPSRQDRGRGCARV